MAEYRRTAHQSIKDGAALINEMDPEDLLFLKTLGTHRSASFPVTVLQKLFDDAEAGESDF